MTDEKKLEEWDKMKEGAPPPGGWDAWEEDPFAHIGRFPRSDLPVLLAALKDWTDIDVAAYQLGLALGMYPPEVSFLKLKGIFWSNNKCCDMLCRMLKGMRDQGVLEYREEPDYQYRAAEQGKGAKHQDDCPCVVCQATREEDAKVLAILGGAMASEAPHPEGCICANCEDKRVIALLYQAAERGTQQPKRR